MKRPNYVAAIFAFIFVTASGSALAADADPRNADEPERPQTPAGPFPYRIEQVRFAGASPEVQLAGSLTLPVGGTRVPAILLVHGSGPVDRDSSAYGHKPFLVIADALTRVGYAVLRYDKRGVAESSGEGRAATTLDLAADAAAALGYLRSRPEIDKTRVALIGHSEGGTIAVLLSGAPQGPSASISLAGMIAPFAEQMPVQEVLTGKDLGADESYANDVSAFYTRVSDALRIEDDAQRLRAAQAISAAWSTRFPEGHVNHAAAAESLLARPKMLASAWFRTLMQLDVNAAIRQSKQPMLFMNGSTDRQVVAEPNLRAARGALGKETALRRTLLLPGLNHMFQESESGSSEEYGDLAQTFSPTALRAVVAYLAVALPPDIR